MWRRSLRESCAKLAKSHGGTVERAGTCNSKCPGSAKYLRLSVGDRPDFAGRIVGKTKIAPDLRFVDDDFLSVLPSPCTIVRKADCIDESFDVTGILAPVDSIIGFIAPNRKSLLPRLWDGRSVRGVDDAHDDEDRGADGGRNMRAGATRWRDKTEPEAIPAPEDGTA